ncbi:hypothetical protein UY3_05664 [Chelonia mydas]|uniref:Uncharacterized protein n=1 Tax=Chelonia mydas TaxID=8469 RepID=M7BYG7_CHEMY|nr:hypothetical protein UY3_05664 [Chelonia mydas]
MLVPGAPPMSTPCSRGKPPLGSPQLPPAQCRSQSRECSQCCSQPSDCLGQSPYGLPSTPTRLSLAESHLAGSLCTARPQGANIDGTTAGIANSPRLGGGTAVGHGTIVDTVPTRTPAPSLHQDIAAPGVDCRRLTIVGPPVEAVRRAAVTIGIGPPRRDHGPMAVVDPGTATPPGPETAADLTPARSPFIAVLRWARPANPNSWPRWCHSTPVPQQVQWHRTSWPAQWYQWALWPLAQPPVGAYSVAGASEAPSASLSRPPRKESVGRMSSAPCPKSDQVVDPPVPADTQSTAPASLQEAIAAPSPSVPQEDFRAHQELLKRVAASLYLQAEEMEESSDSLFNALSPSAPGRVALPLHEGVAKISNALWQTPASLAPISKKAECKYFVPTKGHEYLYTHPAPNSPVVKSVNHREWQGQPAPTPKNKDSRRLDSFGRKIYSSSSFELRVANHQAFLSQYKFNL